jgi:ribosome-binding protein aMBF1 (putative translation factor)
MSTPSVNESLLKKSMAAWFKDVRETQDMNQKQFASWLGVKNKVVIDIEDGKEEPSKWIRDAIHRRTGRRFGEKLYTEQILPEQQEPPVTASEPERIPRVRIKKEFIPVMAARKEVVQVNKSGRLPKDDAARLRVSVWLRTIIRQSDISQRNLAAKFGVKESYIRDLVYCKTRLHPDIQVKIMEVYGFGPDDVGQEVPGPEDADPTPEAELAPDIGAKEVEEFEREIIEKIHGVDDITSEIDECINFGSPFMNKVVELVSNTETYPPEKPDYPKPEPQPEIECTELSRTFRFGKKVTDDICYVFLEIDMLPCYFKILTPKSKTDIKSIHSIDFHLAVAELYLEAVHKAKEVIEQQFCRD